MSLGERASYLIARLIVAAAFDVWDLGRVRRMTKKKDNA